MIERDRAPGIAGALPRRDRRRLDRSFSAPLRTRMPVERRDHRFGRGEAEQRRIDAVAVGITLGDDAAVLHDHDRPGVAKRRLCPARQRRDRAPQRVAEFAARRSMARRCRATAPASASRRRHRDVGDRTAMIEIAAERLVAIDGMAPAEAEQRHRDVLARAIDAVVERPGDQAGAGHRATWFRRKPASGSRPETKVSEQSTLATKPVATFGTSRARAAVQRERAERGGGWRG